MKRLTLIIITILTLVGCRHERLLPVVMNVVADTTFHPSTAFLRIDTMALQSRKDSIREELSYYLERHNVQDEGYGMVAKYATNGIQMLTMPRMKLFNIGRWSFFSRNGGGMERDHRGILVVGRYEADTLFWGIRPDTLGTYAGDFAKGRPCGHGTYLAVNGSYYEGAWKEGQRYGFGCYISPDTPVKAGEWKEDKYRGERMNYTTERVYGIDISRYQHGKGRRKYPILWNKLRISHLGTLSRKRISGTVNYPVAFVFIKSTEGVTIRNPYYANDYRQARQQGIPVGAYHFFSCKTNGAAQARHFLRNTRFRHGDLPPVLDIEPSEAQIRAAGGIDALFTQIRSWLHIVRAHTGVRPILYINQSFVNKHLNQASDIKRDYAVWIARYGEFKPDVRLAIWQLCPDGRVNGIRGEVDINVFNGYEKQFKDFLKKNTIQ